MTLLSGNGALRSVLNEAKRQECCNLGDLTVLSPQVDPYRLDTSSGHRDGAWLARQLDRAIGPDRRIHWRGLHYAIVAQGDVVKPDGDIYRNTDKDWTWMFTVAGKAARWLQHIPFDRITDNRNGDPVIHRKGSVEVGSFVSSGIDIELPGADDILPTALAYGFEPRQRYAMAIFGEKTSLEDVLLPIAEQFEADLYLPAGEISDTQLHRMAKDAYDDGRRLVLFTLADFDPSGHQMAVSMGRKFQAFRDLLLPDLEFEVVPVCLNAEQVRALGLPSTPLKDTELRADRWRGAFGVEQTEIDALATLRPDDLRKIVVEAMSPYYDATLPGRVRRAAATWQRDAAEVIEAEVDAAEIDKIRDRAADLLEFFTDEAKQINRDLVQAVGDIDLPPIEIPVPLQQTKTLPLLISSAWTWTDGTRALKARKSYDETEVPS